MNTNSKRPGYFRRSVACLLLTSFSLQLVGCQATSEEKIISKGFSNLIGILEKDLEKGKVSGAELRLNRANKALDLAQKAAVLAGAPPALDGKLTGDAEEAKVFVRANQPRIDAWLDEFDLVVKGLRQSIFEVSKEAYEASKGASVQADVVSRDSTLVYLTLQAQKQIYQKIAFGLAPLVTALGSDALREVQELTPFRDSLLKRFFIYFGSQIVSDRDLTKTIKTLKGLREQKSLVAELDAIITETHEGLQARTRETGGSLKEGLQKLSPEEQAKVTQAVEEIRQKYENVSFLYSPEQNLNFFLNLLVIIGNLTWGLVNTLIGIGIIIVTILVSPFSPYVDFPTFRIAKNGKQIYVDVSGMSPMRGKMSMGIFELDNQTGWDFASGHEGAHSIQSAMLGPFYLPVVLATYAIYGFDKGPMEWWADAWADL